jgi:acetate kinase
VHRVAQSAVKAYVVHTDEETIIARETARVLAERMK